jgi:hypothetical protein
MNFKKATDRLCARIDHEDVAKALGVSIQSIRQARMKPTAAAHREPPANWRQAIVKLAKRRIAEYRRLIERLDGESEQDRPPS